MSIQPSIFMTTYMCIIKRIKYNFITIITLRTTALIVTGAFLFNTSLGAADMLRPLAAGEAEGIQRFVRQVKLGLSNRTRCSPEYIDFYVKGLEPNIRRICQILGKYPEARISPNHLYLYINRINESDPSARIAFPVFLNYDHFDFLRDIIIAYNGEPVPARELPLVELERHVPNLDRDTATMESLDLRRPYNPLSKDANYGYFRLFADLTSLATRYNLIAHGTKRGRKTTNIRNRKALLGIMLDGQVGITSRYGELSNYTLNNPNHPAMWGPYYVIFDASFRLSDVAAVSPVYPIPSSVHRIYLVPRDIDAQIITENVLTALRLGLITPERAQEALFKLMTYQQFVDAGARIKDVVEGKIRPIDLINKSAYPFSLNLLQAELFSSILRPLAPPEPELGTFPKRTPYRDISACI